MGEEHAKGPPPEWTGERYIPEIAGEIRLEHMHRYLIARELSHGKRVLDIASGEGYGSAMLAAVAEHVFGVDIAASAIADASTRYALPNIEFRTGSCDAIPLPDSSVDVVVSFETIEHIERHNEMMREVRRVMRPGGLLIISSPDRREYSGVLGNRNHFHVRELDRDEFERLLRSHFSHVVMGGQRVRAGSIVAPLEESTSARFVTFPSAEPDAQGVSGLDAPVYLIALASDLPLPALPTGLTEGGAYIWSSDLGTYYAQVQGQCAAEIARRLGEVAHLDADNPQALQAEFTRQADRVSELAAVRVIAKALAAASEASERRGQRLESDLQTAHQRAGQREREFAQERTLFQAQVAHLQDQIAIYQGSLSWRITAPIRAARRRLGRTTSRLQSFLEGIPRKDAVSATAVDASQLSNQISEPEPAEEKGGGSFPSWLYEEPIADYIPLNRSVPVETRIKAHRVLSAAVPPHPRERRVVGQGIHRVDERHPGQAAIRRPLSAAPARRAGVLRSAADRGPAAPDRAGEALWRITASATTITGSAAGSCCSGRSSSSWHIPSSIFLSASAGPTRTGRGHGMAWMAKS